MRASELLRLVIINISQNKLKTIMTSIGIVVGAATIVMVIAIGRGGQMDVAEQFAGLNAGAIDVTYEYKGEKGGSAGGGSSFGNFFGNMFGGGTRQNSGQSSGQSQRQNPGQSGSGSSGRGDASARPSGNGSNGGGSFTPPSGNNAGGAGNAEGNGAPTAGNAAGNGAPTAGNGAPGPGNDQGTMTVPFGDGTPEAGRMDENEMESGAAEEIEDLTADRINQEKIQLTRSDADDIELFAAGVSSVTVSYTIRADVEGAQLTEASSYTVAGVEEEYLSLGNLSIRTGEWFDQTDNDTASRVCVLGASLAKELFGNADAAQGEKLYLSDRSYTVLGVLESSQAVFAGISPDEVIFVPYETGIKYIAGSDADTIVTVIADDVDNVSQVEEEVQEILSERYPNAEFSFSDAGSKMEAAEKSNRILTMLLMAMAAIVFLVGGIGIMNVLFVSVKERTNEIGVLKALGASRRMILTEFLLESAAISSIGGLLGIGLSFGIVPIVEYYGMRVEPTPSAYGAALGFAVLTGTLFGFYPAWKASRLVPVEALNAE